MIVADGVFFSADGRKWVALDLGGQHDLATNRQISVAIGDAFVIGLGRRAGPDPSKPTATEILNRLGITSRRTR